MGSYAQRAGVQLLRLVEYSLEQPPTLGVEACFERRPLQATLSNLLINLKHAPYRATHVRVVPVVLLEGLLGDLR
jgi:hypothetical protein